MIAQVAVDDDTAWNAVLARDASFDHRFVYAVASTGVYCRPSCASRRPARRQVSFFPRLAAAEAAGYRPCRRCHPRDSAPPAATLRVARAREFLDQHVDQSVTLTALAQTVGMSPYHLHRVFKKLTGFTPKEYLNARRAERLRSRLQQGESVSRATYEAGYGSSRSVYEQSYARLGMTPAAYRRGGQGMQIRYSLVTSPMGRLLVAATERGICSVQLGDSDSTLEEHLRREYPAAEIERAQGEIDEWVADVVGLLRGHDPISELPLDVRATSFQWQVWKALQQIPLGMTKSYRDIARAVGRPAAMRAVARACATNPVALVVPCHRAVRADGELGGYRWGVERKRKLLEQERRAATRRARVS